MRQVKPAAVQQYLFTITEIDGLTSRKKERVFKFSLHYYQDKYKNREIDHEPGEQD
jgi:hypothetical protein